MAVIIAPRGGKSKAQIGVQLRLFEHSRFAGLCVLFETWRLWNGSSLFAGLGSKRGKEAEHLALTYVCRGPIGAKNQTGLTEAVANDELFEHYVPQKITQWDLSRFLAWFGVRALPFWQEVILKIKSTEPIRGGSAAIWVLDDTILEKTGRTISDVRKLYDHAKQQFVHGISYVQLLSVDRGKQYPLFFGIHSKRGRKPAKQRERTAPIGKLRIAQRLISQALACGCRPRAIVFDSWYAATCLLRVLRRFHLPFVSRLCGSRNLLLDGRKVKAKDLGRNLGCARYYRRLKVRAVALAATLPNYGTVQVVVFKQRRKSPVILITDLLDADLTTIIELYRQRWAIETWFKEIKQRYGLDKFQHRSAARVRAHVVLTLLSYLLVALLQQLIHPIQQYKAHELFLRVIRIAAAISLVDGVINIITGAYNHVFRESVLCLNELLPLSSTA